MISSTSLAFLVRAQRGHDLRGRLFARRLLPSGIRPLAGEACPHWRWGASDHSEAFGTSRSESFSSPSCSRWRSADRAASQRASDAGASILGSCLSSPFGGLLVPAECMPHGQTPSIRSEIRGMDHLRRVVSVVGDAAQPILLTVQRLALIRRHPALHARPSPRTRLDRCPLRSLGAVVRADHRSPWIWAFSVLAVLKSRHLLGADSVSDPAAVHVPRPRAVGRALGLPLPEAQDVRCGGNRPPHGAFGRHRKPGRSATPRPPSTPLGFERAGRPTPSPRWSVFTAC